MQQLLAKNARVDAVNQAGATALSLACEEGHSDVVGALLGARPLSATAVGAPSAALGAGQYSIAAQLQLHTHKPVVDPAAAVAGMYAQHLGPQQQNVAGSINFAAASLAILQSWGLGTAAVDASRAQHNAQEKTAKAITAEVQRAWLCSCSRCCSRLAGA